MRCKKLTSLLHGNVQTLDLTVNSTIDYACREGYIREGIKSRTCRANKITAYWDPPEQTSTVSCKGSSQLENSVFYDFVTLLVKYKL